jgi:hypothetical protein
MAWQLQGTLRAFRRELIPFFQLELAQTPMELHLRNVENCLPYGR